MKGGAAGQNIKNIMADESYTLQDDANEAKRAVIVYLNEDPETLIKENMDAEQNQEADPGNLTIRKGGAEPSGDLEDVGVITEDAEMLHDLGNTADAVAVWPRLLDWSLPTKLNTSEVLQRTVTETVSRQKTN